MSDFLITRSNQNAPAFRNTSFEVRPLTERGFSLWQDAMSMGKACACTMTHTATMSLLETFDRCMVKYKLE